MSALTSIVDNKTYQSSTQKRVRAYDPYEIKAGKSQLVGIPYLRNAQYKPIDVLVQEARISDTPRLGQSMLLPDRRLSPLKKENETLVRGGARMDLPEIVGDIKEMKAVSKSLKVAIDLAKTLGLDDLVNKLSKVLKIATQTGFGSADKVKKAVERFIEASQKGGQMGEGILSDLGSALKTIIKNVAKGAVKAEKYARDTKIISKGLAMASPISVYIGHPEIGASLAAASATAKSLGYGQTPQAVGRVGNPMVMKGSGLQEDIKTTMAQARGVMGNEKMAFVPTHPMNYKRASLL